MLGAETTKLIIIPSNSNTLNTTNSLLLNGNRLHPLAPSIYCKLPPTTYPEMCFKVYWDRACTVCGMPDDFSEDVVHCPTIKKLGLDNGMMDCVAKNKIFYANAAPYVCDDCSGEDEESNGEI